MYCLSRISDDNAIYLDGQGMPMAWHVEDNAIDFFESRNNDVKSTFRVRSMVSTDYNRLRRTSRSHKLRIVDGEDVQGYAMKTKPEIVGDVVRLYGDTEHRKFAIATNADSEDEFMVDVASMIAIKIHGTASADTAAIKLREWLPLVVDICCKYRGYKAERVTERRELIAGDLELPTL